MGVSNSSVRLGRLLRWVFWNSASARLSCDREFSATMPETTLRRSAEIHVWADYNVMLFSYLLIAPYGHVVERGSPMKLISDYAALHGICCLYVIADIQY